MQVGIVTPRYPPTVAGGGEISVKLLADQLSTRGDTVTVYSFDGGDENCVDGVSVLRFPSLPHGVMELSNSYAGYALWRHRDELASLDILHAYNVSLTPSVGWLASVLSVPSVATLNSYDLLPKSSFGVKPNPPRRLYEILAMPTTGRVLRKETRKIDRFVTLSEASKRVYRENGFAEVPIDTVSNMLDPSFSVPDLQNDTDRFDLLYVGSLIREKGVSFLVRAVADLPDDVFLRVVGSGPEAAQLQSLADDIGVADRIEFTGSVPYSEVRRHYATADCFVHPGVWPEPFGRTMLEAMQAGLSVVATNVGGPSEVVPQTEFLCPPRDSAALADAITIAREQSDVGEENRSYVYDKFEPDVVVNRLQSVYTRAIEES